MEKSKEDKEIEENYKQRLRDYARISGHCNPKILEEYRDKCLDTVRLINEVLAEYD